MPAIREVVRNGSIVPDHFHVRILKAAIVQVRPDWWNYRRICDPFWRLYANERDGASIVANGRRYPLLSGRVHFIPPWFQFDCDATGSVEHLFLHFDLVGLSGLIVRRAFPIPVTLDPNSALDELVKPLRAQLPRGWDLRCLCSAKAFLFAALSDLIGTLDTAETDYWRKLSQSAGKVSAAVRYVEEHLGDTLWNKHLAGLCHLCPGHFIRAFRQSTGQTPSQYILERRIASAAQRLTFGDGSIDQLATELGFANRFHFTRIFTSRMGIPPAAYRRATHAYEPVRESIDRSYS